MAQPCEHCGYVDDVCPCHDPCAGCDEIEARCRCIHLCEECGFWVVPQLGLIQPCNGLRCRHLGLRDGKWAEVVG